MGYTYRNNGNIKDFWPDDTEDTIHVQGERSLSEIIDLAKDHFGDVDFQNISIKSEYIHTSCLTYDQYDSSDYTKFIIIRLETK